MSIEDLIEDRVDRGMLFQLVPKAAGSSPRRVMFICERLHQLLATEHQDQAMEERLGILQADLEVFVEGQPIDPKYLFLLYPARDAVWEIRSIRADPSIRVLGRFALKDVFIATNMELRERLGGWQSRAWKTVKRAACAAWGILFHTYQPMASANVHELVTGAVNGKYFRSKVA